MLRADENRMKIYDMLCMNSNGLDIISYAKWFI